MTPTFDADGYPTDETLDIIANWEPSVDVSVWIAFCVAALHKTYSTVCRRGNDLWIATGGWSGNEDIIEAMRQNVMWSLCFRFASAGGGVLLRTNQDESPLFELLHETRRAYFEQKGIEQ